MSVWTLRFANVYSQIKQMWVTFTRLKMWVAIARHNFQVGVNFIERFKG